MTLVAAYRTTSRQQVLCVLVNQTYTSAFTDHAVLPQVGYTSMISNAVLLRDIYTDALAYCNSANTDFTNRDSND